MRRRRRGFTFTEMIACLAVIVLCVSVLLPVYGRSREAARRTSCASNLRQFGQALHLYAQDYAGRFPAEETGWAPALSPYIKNSSVFACPDDRPAARAAAAASVSTPGALPLPAHVSYRYRPGLAHDDWSELPLAWDRQRWHGGGVNLLYLGGNSRHVFGAEIPR